MLPYTALLSLLQCRCSTFSLAVYSAQFDVVAIASCIILDLDLSPYAAATLFHLVLAATDVGYFSVSDRIRLIVVGLRPAAIPRVVPIVPLVKFPSSVAIATAFLISIDSQLLLVSILLLLLFHRYVLQDALFRAGIQIR